MGTFHKAGFTYCNLVGRCLGAAVTNNMNLITGGSKNLQGSNIVRNP